MAYYKDLREYLKVLEDKGKLIRIKREINKDTELHPLRRMVLFVRHNPVVCRFRGADLHVLRSYCDGQKHSRRRPPHDRNVLSAGGYVFHGHG